MSIEELESVVSRLPQRQRRELLAFLANQLERAGMKRARTRRGLKAAGRAPLQGLPADLSTGTKERVRTMVAKRHAAHR